ncbi:hypothetical protein ACWD60_36805, partial [Streptomyces sp. NPDC005167]
MKGERLRFDGWIAGVGTTSGTRLVVGHWTRSPFGPFSDVMIQHPNGERLLLAPSAAVADFVATTYRFESVEVVPVTVRRGGSEWSIQAGPLSLHLSTGSRTPLGWLLRDGAESSVAPSSDRVAASFTPHRTALRCGRAGS